jgi:ATP phosphoribosyltransferase regulatory subunit
MFMFEKPQGMRDTLPDLYSTKEKIRSSLTDVIKGWGYQLMETPTLEFYETVGFRSAISEENLFKLLDHSGQTLVLRPDMTGPIARVAASKIKKQQHPLRIGYSANVFRAQEREGGRPAEFEQTGVELIGDRTISADAEVIALAISSLKNAGLKGFQVAIGHIGITEALLFESAGDREASNRLRRFLYQKNYVGYKEEVNSLTLGPEKKRALLELPELRGDMDKGIQASRTLLSEEGKNAADDLRKLHEILKELGCTEHIKLDLSMVSHMSYYTGILFEIYAENVGYLIGNGGRYDHLLDHFQAGAPATGFAIRTDRLVEALHVGVQEAEIEAVVFSEKYRKEAIRLAANKRMEGKKVVLQDIDGVSNFEDLEMSFQNITYLTGDGKEEQNG